MSNKSNKSNKKPRKNLRARDKHFGRACTSYLYLVEVQDKRPEDGALVWEPLYLPVSSREAARAAYASAARVLGADRVRVNRYELDIMWQGLH